MKASETPDLAAIDAESVTSPAVEKRRDGGTVLSSIDFAKIIGSQLLVYGWAIGFARLVQSANIEIGGLSIDLVKHATRVRRPDVARHFSLDQGNDEHGFYALVDLPAGFSFDEKLTLSIALSSGATGVSLWPVACFESGGAAAIEPHAITLNQLLPRLSKKEARRLIEFGSPFLLLPAEVDATQSLPFPARFGIDLCCILEDRVLVVSGWCYDPLNELTGAELRVGESSFPILSEPVLYNRSDIDPESALPRLRGARQHAGFISVHLLPARDVDADEALFTFSAAGATEQLSYKVSNDAHGARRDLVLLVNKLDSESAFVLIEQLASGLDDSPSLKTLVDFVQLVRQTVIDRFPPSIQEANPRYALHVDQAIPIADKGLFLIGWFNAEVGASVRVLCHCGNSVYAVSDNWTRHPRQDVSAHLAGTGIQVAHHTHGFSCYVPLSSAAAPYFLSAQSASGKVRQMRISVREKPESALQTVRELATSFSSTHPELRFLMDSQIGPAIGDAWSARTRLVRPQAPRYFGNRPSHPKISVLVPLYGRYDFAEYQMALFANDPEFQSLELIYIVDDPQILAEFSAICAGLYGIYQVPFTLASPGVNLGFAGANNFGAGEASGDYLLFLNSDVMPRRPGWAGDLLRTYKSLQNPGVLGAKLLYEDGSVQHAGMAFRRYSGWGNLWINDHPYKGQSPLGLAGVHEAEAVTAACALVKASLFRKVGGFSEDYIVGDFEDSDLCLRLAAAGKRSFVALDVELYHLERQSQNRLGDDTWRTNLTLYNCWLHNSRWGETIEKRVNKDLEPKPVS